MYQAGKGVAQDYAQAVYWYRKAAEQGNDIAENDLAVMYENGAGVVPDVAQAIYWYRKSAAQGNADAQANLARLGE
jgi:TPR repeat protein